MTSTNFHRRNFLSLAGKSLGLAALSSSTVGALLKNIQAATKSVVHLTPEQAAMDEDYWSTIQNAFTVTRGIINLNNGGVSPSPRLVTEALVRYIWQQEDATAYTMWQILEPQSETIRTGLAELFGCDREEIAITRNASESLETLLLGMDLKSGDEVLTTTQDYGRMLTTIRQREQREGIKLNLIKIPIPPKNINEITAAFEHAITPRTRLIQIAHQINITGQINSVPPRHRRKAQGGAVALPFALLDGQIEGHSQNPFQYFIRPESDVRDRERANRRTGSGKDRQLSVWQASHLHDADRS